MTIFPGYPNRNYQIMYLYCGKYKNQMTALHQFFEIWLTIVEKAGNYAVKFYTTIPSKNNT